jgi:hypothetical protein
MEVKFICSDPDLSFQATLTEMYVAKFPSPKEAVLYFLHNFSYPTDND